jgi:glycosyltransferase involved in cell wall biosynthesis
MQATSREALRVLVVGAQFPFPPRSGFETRFYQLLRQLASRHEITLLTYAAADELSDAEELRSEFDVEVVQRNPISRLEKRRDQLVSLTSTAPFAARDVRSGEMQDAIDRLSAHREFDAVQLESIFLWGYRFPTGTRIVLDEHNVEYEVFARMRDVERSALRRSFYRLEEIRVRRFEQSAWRQVAGCVVTSPREEQIVRAHAPETPTVVVPNSVDVDYFRPTGADVADRTIVFNGVLDYWPNVDAAHFLVDEVMPILRERCPGVRLMIVGRGRPAELEAFRRPDVDVTGEVPDVRPYLEGAAVVAVPIRMGGGTRLKVVEGLALEKPLVSTTLGCEGIDVRDGEHLLIADTAESFASQVMRIFDAPELGRALGSAGRSLVAREYSWDAAGERLAELYAQVVRRGPEAVPQRVVSERGE